MMNVANYIALLLEKKGWTRTRLCEEINKLEANLGDKRTPVQTVSDYLNGAEIFRPKVLAKWEIALGLSEGTLMNMVVPPLSKEGKAELSRTIEELRKLR